MTNLEKQQLWDGYQRGTLTDAQHEQWLALMRDDPDFYDEWTLQQALTDAARRETYQSLQAAALEARREPEEQHFVVIFIQQNARQIIASIMFLLLAGGGFWWWQQQQTTRIEQAIKSSLYDVFANDNDQEGGMGYMENIFPTDSLRVLWFINDRQTETIRYRYCRDTLRLYVPDAMDTTRLLDIRLLYNSRTRIMSAQLPKQQPQVLAVCSEQVKPLN